MNIIKSISILSLLTLSGLLSACVAGTSPAVMGVAPTSELSSIEQKLEENTAQVQRLQDSLVMLEVRLLDQQRLVEELRRKVAGGEFASGAAPASGAASASKNPLPKSTGQLLATMPPATTKIDRRFFKLSSSLPGQ